MTRAGKGITRRELVAAGLGVAAAPARAAAAPDAVFTAAANDYIARWLESEPDLATSVGDHRYDDRLTDASPEAVAPHRRSR